MRFAEIALLALPLLVFVAWRVMAPTSGPPKILVIGVSVAVVAMAGLLLVLWAEEAEPPGALYVPARQENGRIVPPHVVEPLNGTAPAPSSPTATPPAASPPGSPAATLPAPLSSPGSAQR